MAEVKLADEEILVSFDVKSLFTSIPVEESIRICETKLREDAKLSERTPMEVETIVKLLRFCLTNTSFLFQGKHYQQLDGVAMGSPVSPVIADIFMEDLEDKFFRNCLATCKPRLWRRFVDDIISIIKKSDGDILLEELKKQHTKIAFTMEKEKDGSLPFMDVRFTRRTDGTLARRVFQKETHTNRYIQSDSHHPDSVKASVIQGLVDRAIKISSDEGTQKQEIGRITNVMASNGYNTKFVRKAIAKQMRRSTMSDIEKIALKEQHAQQMEMARIPFVDGLSQQIRRLAREAGVRCSFYMPNKLDWLYQAKDDLPRTTTRHAIYSVKCGTCESEYVGETLRAVNVRSKEHRDAIRLGQTEKSAIADHVHNQVVPHEIDWNSLKVIDRATKKRERKIREAFHIHKRNPGMNRDIGTERSAVWNALL